MNIYKISTIALSIVVLILTTLLISNQLSDLSIDSDLGQSFRTRGFSPDSGAILDASVGKRKLDSFIKNRKSDLLHRFKKSTYGYFFGIDKVNLFMEHVNELDPSDGQDIIGIRVYRSISIDPETKKEYFDVFMIPVTEDGFNYPKIDSNYDYPFIDDGEILNTSTPCPNNCDPDPELISLTLINKTANKLK
jgi:hypothetical protein